jgi:hypothetical protein
MKSRLQYPQMGEDEMRQIAKKQGVTFRAIYRRAYRGWTGDEIRAGAHTRPRKSNVIPDYKPQFKLHRNILTNGTATFRVLILEVVASIINCGEKKPLEFNDFLCACLVYRDLLDMSEIQRG